MGFTFIKLKQAKQQQPLVQSMWLQPQSPLKVCVCVALEDILANKVRNFKLHIVKGFKYPDMHNHDNVHL